MQAADPKQDDSESPDSWTEMPPSLCCLTVVQSEVSNLYVTPAQAKGSRSEVGDNGEAKVALYSSQAWLIQVVPTGPTKTALARWP